MTRFTDSPYEVMMIRRTEGGDHTPPPLLPSTHPCYGCGNYRDGQPCVGYCYVSLFSPSGMGSADFAITLTATADAQYDTFLNIKNYTCKQSGAYVNFKSWVVTSKSHKISNGNKNCTVTFVGDLTVEYTEPTTGLLVGYTSTHQIDCTFKA